MDILKKIKNGEKTTCEFKDCKRDVPESLFESVCAFLNRVGGDVFLGVKDDRTIVGIDADCVAKIKSDIVTACNNPNKISPTIYFGVQDYVIDGKIVLHFYVPESSQVHSTAGKIFDRNEDGDFNITGNTNLIARMYIRKQREYTENTVYPYATMDDLDVSTINRVRIMAVNRHAAHPWGDLTNDELLKSAGLYKHDLQTGNSGYTLACLLLFGKDETIFSALPYFKTDAIYRKGNLDRYDDRDEVKSNIIKSCDRLMSFIEKHLDDKFYMEGEQRIDVRSKLFHEAVVNSLIHREYSNAYPARLIIENNKVITENGNKARGYGVVDLDDFTPYPKNPVIASVFKEIGWTGELGSGVRNIKKYSAIYSGSQPIFEDGDVFRVIIPLVKKESGEVNAQSGEVNTQSGEVNAQSGEVNLAPKELVVLKLIRSDIKIKRKTIIERSGYSKNTVDKILRALKDKGFIKGRTSDKGGCWVL